MNRARIKLLAAMSGVAFTIGGCGFARSGEQDATAPTSPAPTDEVGVGLTVPTEPAPAAPPAPPGPAAPGAAPPAPGAVAERGAANQSRRDDPSGLRVVLTVGGRLRYASTDDIVLQLEVTNTSGQTLHYDSNQRSYFIVRPPGGEAGTSWRDSDCRSSDPGASRTPALTLEPGESITVQALYPASEGRDGRDSCRVPPGSYEVLSGVDWCPPGTVRDNTCSESETKRIFTGTVPITIS